MEIVRPLSPRKDIRAVRRLTRLLREHDFAVVHTHTTKGGLVGRLAALFAGTPVTIHTLHNFAFGPDTRRVFVWLNLAVEWLLGRMTTHTVAVSEGLGSMLRRYGIAAEPNLSVIHNGVPDVSPSPRAEAPREPVIVYHGRLAPAKGLETLLSAVSRLHKQGMTFDLRVFGEGEYENELRRLAVDMDLDEGIFRGFTEDVAGALADADVCVQPSDREGLSIALIEALRAERCAVTSDIEPNLEVIGSGGGALTFKRGDVDDLSKVLSAALLNSRLRRDIAVRGRSRYVDEFSEQMMNRRYLSVYRSLVPVVL